MARSDYSKRTLPYGAGTTDGMTKRHYEAIADTLRNVYTESPKNERPAVLRVIYALCSRLARGNYRFDRTAFVNAATDAARKDEDTDDS